MGFNRAGIVDHAGQQRVFGPRVHHHLATASPDQAAVVGQCIDGALLYLNADHAAALKAQRDGTAAAQAHKALGCLNAPLVTDRAAHQRHIATAGRMEAALVDDAACTRAAEAAAAGIEARVTDVQCGGDQRADVDLCALAKQDAVGVDQENLSVGADASENLAAVVVMDAVDRNGRGRRLHKIDAFLLADVEALPAQGQVGAALRNSGGGTRLGDAAYASGDQSPLGLTLGDGRAQRYRCGNEFAA